MLMMGYSSSQYRSSGFTLIEMVVTIVIIGILGVGISSFIGNTTKGMVDTAERSQVATIAWLVSERLSKSLRHALPNSIRINTTDGRCLEYIPIYAGTDYLSVPIAVGSSQFEVAPFSNLANGFNFTTQPLRAAVYPHTTAGLYTLTTTSMISSAVSQLSAGTTTNAQAITLSTSHQFPLDSPNNRLFLVTEPNMFCFRNGQLVHYRDYGYNAVFTDSSTDLSNDTVMGSSLGQGSNQGTFNYTPSTLQRNGVISIDFKVVGDDSLVQSVNQEVQIRNVP